MPIAGGLSIIHGGNVFLNAKRIGRNCTIYQGITIGAKSKTDKSRAIIEDNVTICTGAVCVGGITIHSGAVVVINDFPENVFISGVPARIVKTVN